MSSSGREAPDRPASPGWVPMTSGWDIAKIRKIAKKCAGVVYRITESVINRLRKAVNKLYIHSEFYGDRFVNYLIKSDLYC